MFDIKTVLIDGIEQLREISCAARRGETADSADVDRLADELVEVLRQVYRLQFDHVPVNTDSPRHGAA